MTWFYYSHHEFPAILLHRFRVTSILLPAELAIPSTKMNFLLQVHLQE